MRDDASSMDPRTGSASLLPDRSGWMLIGALALLFCWNLNRTELSVTDEARSGVIVRDMVERGHWLLPRTPDGYLCEKPPAYYGTAALLGGMSGVSEWTLRLVSVLAGLGTLVATWILARLYGGPLASWGAVIALASNVLFMGCAREALVDMTLSFFLTAGLVAYFAARRGKLAPWKASLLSGVAFGFAILSKGPLGLALPIATVGGDSLVCHRGRFWKSLAWWKQGTTAGLVAVTISCLWYVPGFLKGGSEFLETCLLSENFWMVIGKTKGIGVSHEKSHLYYLGIQLASVLPMLPFLPLLIGWAKDRLSDPARSHLLAWFSFGFLLFEIASNKRMYYLMPLQPAAAVMIALAAERSVDRCKLSMLRVSVGTVGALALLGSLAAGGVIARPSMLAGIREGTVAAAITDHRGALVICVFVLLGVGVRLLLAVRQGALPQVMGSFALALLVVAIRFGVGDVLETSFERTRPFIATMAARLPQGQSPVVMPSIRGYSIDFYWPAPLLHDGRAALSANHVLVARSNLSKFASGYETLATWKYGPGGRDDVLLLRREPSR